MPGHFKRSTKRLIILLASLPAVIVILGYIYMLGMAYLEGTPRGFWASIEWASETITTTGYGADGRWQHPLMNLLVIVTQFLGLFLSVLFFPVYVLPYFEEQFEARLPRALPQMDGHVLIHRYGPSVDSLVAELKRVGIPLVILEQDDSLARSLQDRGHMVVVGKLEEQADLLSGVETARALVTNADDHMNAAFIMIARELGFKGTLLALTEDPLHRSAMEKIGATAVFTPSHVLAAALAARASARISPMEEGLHVLGERVGLAEFRVQEKSPLANQRLGDLQMRERHGVTVIGQWNEGLFTLASGPDTLIESGAILVAVGAHANLRKVESLATPINRRGPIIVAGFGTVGRKIVEMLHDAGETTIVIDIAPASGVDVVGNVLEHSTLDRARVREASAVVLALASDSAGVFAAAVVRDYAQEMPLIARVNRASNVARLYQAGADFALSVGQVAGQILAHHLLGEDAVLVEQRLKFARVAPGTLLGGNPWHAAVREKTGAAIVAVERGEQVFVEFGQDFRVQEDDILFVCGTIAGLDKYMRVFHAAIKERSMPNA
ncbi:MAG: NAD-binding protein [Sterolibacterium sp.]